MLTTISEVIATGLRVSTISDDDTLPDMDEAINKHLLPLLGQSLITALQATYEEPSDIPELNQTLVLAQKTLAAYAYLSELAATHVRITSAGVRRTSTDNMPTAYQWEYKQAQAYLEERTYSTLETLLKYIDDNAEALTDDLDADLINARKSMLLKSGADLGRYVHVQYPFLTWYRMLPILQDVTQMNIIATFGEDFYNELMGVTNNDATTDPTSAESKELIGLLQRAAANITIANAAEKMSVRVTGYGFTVTESQADTGDQTSANFEQLKRLTNRVDKDGNMYLRKAINYANEKASTSLFATYFTSDKYTAPGSNIIDRQNDLRKTFRF
jgi:hypothetical protein